jgi:hypothetical protein
MTESKTKSNFITILKKYVSEVLIIFIGISISFLFDEWRDGRKDRETAQKHLTFLRTNLVRDTSMLTNMKELSEEMKKSANRLAYFKRDLEILDSIDTYIDNAASYVTFKPNRMAYDEIAQTGHTSLITNDSLKRSMLSYYTIIVPYCEEWCAVDKTHTMTQLIPEMSIYFPVVADTFNRVTPQEKVQALKIKKLRNLLIIGAAYKQEVIKAVILTKTVAKNLLKSVDDELKK